MTSNYELSLVQEIVQVTFLTAQSELQSETLSSDMAKKIQIHFFPLPLEIEQHWRNLN